MTDFRPIAPAPRSNASNGNFRVAAAAGQYILNLVGDAARRAADRSRFAALSRRYLDDAGLTPGELDAALPALEAFDARRGRLALAHSI